MVNIFICFLAMFFSIPTLCFYNFKLPPVFKIYDHEYLNASISFEDEHARFRQDLLNEVDGLTFNQALHVEHNGFLYTKQRTWL